MEDPVERARPDKAELDSALAALFATPAFARSERMRAFLSYVVDETVAGRGGGIRAKTIALDVYKRDPSREDYSDNIVRVDARRLRRMLDDYYHSDGAAAPLRISIETGSYVPRFRRVVPPPILSDQSRVPLWRRHAFAMRAFVVGTGVAAIAAVLLYLFVPPTDPPGEQSQAAERLALFERSGAVLQADNLCRQGRSMLFPLADRQQQSFATELFRRAAELAPDYACGYAGAAHSLASQALLAPDPSARDAFLAEAEHMAAQGQALAPKDGWVVSGLAWTALVNRDLGRAAELSELSERLSPKDGNVLDFHGVVSILVGNYEDARRATDPSRARDTAGLDHAHRNIYGVASFHAGDYDAAIASWEDAIRLGEPVSALTLIYLTAAHQARGDQRIAQDYAQDLREAWPGFPVTAVLENLYPQQAVSGAIIALLAEAGWLDPTAIRNDAEKG